METVSLLYAISAFERFHRNSLLWASGGNLYQTEQEDSFCVVREGRAQTGGGLLPESKFQFIRQGFLTISGLSKGMNVLRRSLDTCQ